jgi:hypothetical protein
MHSDQVPDDVRQLLADCVGSLDELGMLLMLTASATRWWTAPTAGAELGITGRRAGQILDRLASCNLLDIKVSNEVSYQFRPGTSQLQERAAALLALYRERPIVVLRWAAGNGLSAASFTDAFRLKW